jgi:hypothetical protein
MLDAVDYYWTRAIISYDLEKQLELFQGTAFRLRGISFRGSFLPVAGLLLVGCGVLLAAALLLHHLAVPAEMRLMKSFLRLVKQRFGTGDIPTSVGLQTLAERTGDARCREFVLILGGAVFRDRSLNPAERARLRKLLSELRLEKIVRFGAEGSRD